MNPPIDPSTHEFVKEKLRQFAAENPANPSEEDARARKETRTGLTKILKKAASIAEMLDEHDAEENLRVIREAKAAMHRVYSKEAGGLVEVPDHKTRLAAAALDLAYRVGLPVQRQVQATIPAQTEDAGETLAKAMKSPALREHLQRMIDRAKLVETASVQESRVS